MLPLQSGLKAAIQGLGIFFLMQFIVGQFFGKQQGGSSQNAVVPAFSDRADRSEISSYSFIPDNVAPVWPTNSSLDMSIYVSPSTVLPTFNAIPRDALVLEEKNFTMGNYSDTREIDTTIKVPKEAQQNGTLWAHFYVGISGSQLDPLAKDYSPEKAYHFLRPLNQYLPKRKTKKLKNLLTDEDNAEEPEDDTPAIQIVSYYHPNFTVSVVPDTGVQKFRMMAPAIRQHLELESTGARDITGQNGWYYPVIFLNKFWQLRSHMTELNSTVDTVPLRITLNNLQNWKFSLMASIDEGMKQNARQAATGGPMPAGGDGSEFEVVKEILLDTSVWLLATTGVVSILHMIFETLAFKNDIVSSRAIISSHLRFYADNVIVALAQEERRCRHLSSHYSCQRLHADCYLLVPG